MATSTDFPQRPKFQYSQSFRHQATQDAIAGDPPLSRVTVERQGSHGVESSNHSVSRLEDSKSTSSKSTALVLDEDNLHHRLNATGSVQAIVVDDDVLFAGLQGGDLVVRIGYADIDMRGSNCVRHGR